MHKTSSSVLIIADEWDPMQVLTERLQSEGDFQVRCIEQDGPDLDLTQFRAIFVYVHNVLEAHVEDALIDYALAGGRLIVLQHAIASAKVANPNWLDFVGIHIQALALVGPNARFIGVGSARAARGLTGGCVPTTRSARAR